MAFQVLIIIGIVIGVLILIRLALPFVLLSFINTFLRKHPALHGTVGSIRISLLSGKIILKNIRINIADENSKIDNLVMTIPEGVFTIQLGALLRKKIITRVALHQPQIMYANVLSQSEEPKKEPPEHQTLNVLVKSPLKTALVKMLPFQADLEILQGTIRYVDNTASPQRDISIQNFELEVRNLSNQKLQPAVPATVVASGNLFEGALHIDLKIQPLEEFLTFDLNLQLEGAEIVLLNDYFRAYAGIDVNAGTLDLFTEIIALDGNFNGYVRPVLKNIDIIGGEDKGDSLIKKIWERVVAVVVQGLENDKLEQLATTIEIKGRLDDPHVNVFSAITSAIRNAFIHGITTSLKEAFSVGSIFKTVLSGTAGLIRKVLL